MAKYHFIEPKGTTSEHQGVPALATVEEWVAECDGSDRTFGKISVCTGSGDPYGTVAAGTANNGVIINNGSGSTSMSDVTDGTSNTFLAGESAWNFPDYTFTSGPCSGQVRWGFSYWSSPYPLATAFTTKGPFNPKKRDGDSNRLANFRSEHIGVVKA